MNQSVRRPRFRAIPAYCLAAGVLGLVACSDDANLGKKLSSDSGTGGTANTSEGGATSGGVTSASGGATSATGGAAHTGGVGETGGTPSTGGALAATGGTPGTGGAVAASGGTPSTGGAVAATGGSLSTGGAVAATGGSPSTGGSTQGGADAGGAGGGDGVILTAVYAPGSGVISAEWYNGTATTIFLRGCSTTDGWYREAGEWKEYGAFANCTVEGLAVALPPGDTHHDLAAGVPPNRGDNVWRLVGPYGTDCTPGVKFSEANCAAVDEATSVNEVSTE